MVGGTRSGEARGSWLESSPYRLLSVSPIRVEVRLYRRSKNSSSITQQPVHLEYFLRCRWSGSPTFSQDPDVPGNWWDDLPQSYEIRRRWSDIVRFHEVVSELATLITAAFRTRMPELPSRGNLDEFTKNLAATGDACALSKGRLNREDPSHDELSLLHSIYVENGLAPYFAQVSTILSEIPPEVLMESKVIRLFATSGPSSLKHRSDQAFDMLMDNASLEAASRALRESASWRSPFQRSSSTPALSMTQAGDQASGGLSSPSQPGMKSGETSAAKVVVVMAPPKEEPIRHYSALAISHYNFFASTAPSDAFNSGSDRELIKRMVAKERREKAHQTMLDPDIPMPIQRDRHFNPSGRSMEERPGIIRSSPSLLQAGIVLGDQPHLGHQAHQPLNTSANAPQAALRLQIMMGDICAGFRTMLLGEETPDGHRVGRRNQPVEIKATDMSEGTPARVLIVYQAYRRLLEGDVPVHSQGGTPADPVDPLDADSDDESVSEEDQKQRRHEAERLHYIQDLGICPELMPINWHTFFTWLDHKIDLADDCRVRSTYAALLRAVKRWRQQEATVAQSHLGVSLNMLFQWIWPKASYQNVARMLTWICQHEFEKIRQPTPPVICHPDQAHIESLFTLLDVKREGYVCAEDIAGREKDSVKAKLRNIVDADTVKAVHGTGPIRLEQFLEIMCEDGFRGHVDATTVQLQNGSRLMRVQREVTGCNGWILEDVPKSEESQRDLINAIEIEVTRWHEVRNAHHIRRNHGHAGDHFTRGGVLEPTEHLPTTLAKMRKTLAFANPLVGRGSVESMN